MLKTMTVISQIEQAKALRILSTTLASLGNFEEVKDVANAVQPENLARLILAFRYIKLV